VFRSGVVEVVVKPSYLCERGLDKLYQVALKKILEFQELVEQQGKDLSRLQTRAQHLGERKMFTCVIVIVFPTESTSNRYMYVICYVR
jgi:hypothetical protein